MKDDSKGFSLIEIIIVIAIMAILVAIIAPNLTKYLGKSKKNVDVKNADEIATQLQNCITDFETEGVYLIDINADPSAKVTVEWTESKGAYIATVDSSEGSTEEEDFADIINRNVTAKTVSKEVAGATAIATITLNRKDNQDYGYIVEVVLGNAKVVK
jgi:type IV pilus assembly protein PilA